MTVSNELQLDLLCNSICFLLAFAVWFEIYFSWFLSLVFARWLLQRGCTGSRNFLDAFRKAVENEEEKAHGIGKITTVYNAISDKPVMSSNQSFSHKLNSSHPGGLLPHEG